MSNSTKSNSTKSYAISLPWAEFADRDTEQAYRLNMQPMLARHLRVAMFVWGSLLLLFALLDLQSLGWSREFFILLACRVVQATLVFSYAVALRRRPQLASCGYAIAGLGIIGFFLVMPIYFLRPHIEECPLGDY